jgi:CBS domain containing-hemolysin-like protein
VTAFQVLVLAACMLGAAFHAGIETGMISIHRMRLRHFVRHGVPGTRILQFFLDNPDRLLGTTLVGTNICVVVTSIVSASLAVRLIGDWGELVSTGVMALVVLVFCEYLPKAWFHSRPLQRCRRFARPLRTSEFVLRPLAAATVWLTRWLVRGPSKAFSRPSPFVTREDLKILAREGERDGVLSPRERFMIHRVFELGAKTARDAMVPRHEMTTVFADTPLHDFLDTVRRTQFTRYPVVDRESGRFTGVVNFFYVMSAHPEDLSQPVSSFARAPLFVPEDMPADEIFPRLRRYRQPLCLVTREPAEVTGLLTTEDVLEEIVGEL